MTSNIKDHVVSYKTAQALYDAGVRMETCLVYTRVTSYVKGVEVSAYSKPILWRADSMKFIEYKNYYKSNVEITPAYLFTELWGMLSRKFIIQSCNEKLRIYSIPAVNKNKRLLAFMPIINHNPTEAAAAMVLLLVAEGVIEV